MNNEMAYLLGMITGNGEIQRGRTETVITIELPHKKMETEFQNDVRVYVKASITDIRTVLEPLLGAALNFSQQDNVSFLSFKKNNEDYIMREIMRFVGNATSHDNIRIAPEVFSFSTDERKQFIKGFADVTGYIRRSNYYFDKSEHRVYFEIPQNWYLVADFCNLLKSVDIPVQNIDWGHPNMRDGQLTKYNQGSKDFWKKEHQVKVWAIEYETIGFGVLHKMEALSVFAEEHRSHLHALNKDVKKSTHRFYWDAKKRKNSKTKPYHPGINDSIIPVAIRGKHYNSWQEIAADLGYSED